MATGLHRDRRGNVALIFALIAPLLLAFVGAGIDYGRYGVTRAALQEIADAAAIAGARQYLLSDSSEALPEAIAESAAGTALSARGYAAAADIEVAADNPGASVSVSIRYGQKPTFLVGLFKNPIEISVAATAQASGGANVCIITLNPTAKDALLMTADARISGANCSIYGNSTNTVGIGVYQNAKVTSKMTCSAGGFGGGAMNYSPTPLTDCPVREDPLKDRTPPTVGVCNYNRHSVSNFVGALQPGVYCGGLTILGNSNIQLQKGIYIIKDGDMQVLGTSRIFGEEVGFYFTGNGADLFLNDDVDISLSAPISGPMAGVLIWQDPAGRTMKVFEVASNNVKTLVGTIYLPKGKFLGRANAPVAQSSAYTAIVAERIELLSGVNVVLNTNYGDTPVPVPAGLAGAGKQVTLRQ